MFGTNRKKREAELRKKTNVYIPNLTDKDKHLIRLFKSSPHVILLDAATEGNVAMIFELMCQGVKVMDEQKNIMMLAIQSDKKSNDVLRLMLQLGARRHEVTASFLEEAIKRDNQEAAELLLEYGSKVDGNCIFVACKAGKYELADKLVASIHTVKKGQYIKGAYFEAIRRNEPEVVKWVENNHRHQIGYSMSEISKAVHETGRKTLEELSEATFKYIRKEQVAEYYIKNDKTDEFHFLLDKHGNSIDFDTMLACAVKHEKYQIIPMLKNKGAKITAQTVILDMLKSRNDWHQNGEGKEEAARRKRLLQYVDDLTQYDSRLLLHMVRNNKAKTVEYLLQNEKNWDSSVIKDGLAFCAENGYYDVLEKIMLNSKEWNAEDYNRAIDNAVSPNMLRRVKQIKDKILGSGWYVDDNHTVRKEQKFEAANGSNRNIYLTTIFNFKACEVTKVMRFSNSHNAEDVTHKNFSEYQSDKEINDAYEKLCKFSTNPVKFNGVAAKVSTKGSRRIIRQAASKSSKSNKKPNP